MYTSETRDSQVVIWIGVVLILINGLVHFVDAPDSFGDATHLGLLVAGGALLGYVLSRTVGLPGGLTDDIGNWLDTLGVVSIVAEALFVALAGRVLAPVTRARRPGSAGA